MQHTRSTFIAIITLPLLSLIGVPRLVRAQFAPPGQCLQQLSPEPVTSPRGGMVLPSKGVINALVLFIDFEDETEDIDNVNWPRGDGPVGIGPRWMGNFIDQTPEQQSGQKFNITTYYRDMSLGQLSIVGYPIYRRARRTYAAYEADLSTTNNIPYWSSRDVLLSLTPNDVGGWSHFDTITTNRNYQQHYGPDGVLDLVIVCYRGFYARNSVHKHGWTNEGIAYLGDGASDYTLNGGPKVIPGRHGSGVVWQHGLTYPDCWVPFHEVGHLLLGDVERYVDANGGLWTTMGERHVSVSNFMNSYEREWLGWITFNEASDFAEADIPDFGTTGVAYRMAFPGNDLLQFYFENHQSLRSPYIKIAPDNSFTYDLVDKRDYLQGGNSGTRGLYIIANDGGQIGVVCADGRWKWYSTGQMPNPFNPALTAQIFLDSAIDRTLGRTDRLPQHGSFNGSPYDEFIWVWRDEITNQPVWSGISGRQGGDGNDTWKPDGNNIFSPWSNPAARFTYNVDLQTGIMQVLAENDDGSVRVKFFLLDRPSVPPSLPQRFRQSTITGFDDAAHPKLAWIANIEPDVTDGGSVEVWRQLQPYGEEPGTWTLVATLPSSATSWADEGVSGARLDGGGTIARYKMRVKDASGSYSNYAKERIVYYGDNPLKMVHHDPIPASGTTATLVARYEDGNVMVRFSAPARLAVRLYDMLGREILARVEEEYAAGLHLIPLATAHLPSGRYYCIVYTNGVPAAQVPIIQL